MDKQQQKVCETSTEVLEAIFQGNEFVLAPTMTTLFLRVLGVSNNSVGWLGVSPLTDSLKSNSTLTSLNLEWNDIGYEGAFALSDSLKSNSTLTTLKLESNSIGDEGAFALSD